MTLIKLPIRFKEKIAGDQKLEGIVNSVLADFGEILNDNKLYFFEEYTDHGKSHIENVLSASDHLIVSGSYDMLTSKDISYYVLSVILHDIGMHIRPEGFANMIDGCFEGIRDEIDNLSWKELWLEYLSEARRFSDKQLTAIFGSEELQFSIPDLHDFDALNGYHRKLIGEFVRRHHPRLAQEIAIAGFPGRVAQPFAPDLALQDRKLIGLIARSHGMQIRYSSDQIERIFGRATRLAPRGVHAIYLMVILRIADYIQIDNSRTSVTLIKLRSLSSPISAHEHDAHLAIDAVDLKYQDDPERIYVTCSPGDSRMFFKLKNLFRGIQEELDLSWAVLGELYGKQVAQGRIQFRRINSNLEEDNFVNGLDYVAEQLSFKANDELIKLLIAPLYGNDPTYGVRELLQNAVDSCKERSLLEADHSYQGGVEIVVQEINDEYSFVISDNGIGMDVDVIKNYFLNAGASFRNSANWKKKFTGETGDVKIERSGRFGVGALASFLIGIEMHVWTKRFDQKVGYYFKASINSASIELKKHYELQTGTRIKIIISKETYTKFSTRLTARSSRTKWNEWYNLSSPKVRYQYGIQHYYVGNPSPGSDQPLPNHWHKIYPPGCTSLLWTYHRTPSDPKFICNGIIIPQDPVKNGLSLGILSNVPRISVFDNNAEVPLTLNREGFAGRFAFHQELERDVVGNFIAYILTLKIESKIADSEISLTKDRISHPGLVRKITADGFSYGKASYQGTTAQSMLLHPLLSKKGFILDYSYFIMKLEHGKRRALFINSNNIDLNFLQIDIKDYFIKFLKTPLNKIKDFQSVMEPKDHSHLSTPALFAMKTGWYELLFDTKIRRISKSFRNGTRKIPASTGWSALSYDGKNDTIISADFLKQNINKIEFIRDYNLSVSPQNFPILNELLERYFGDDVVIPYNIDERKKKFPLAFKELSSHMAQYL